VADHIGIYSKFRSQGYNYEILTLMNNSGDDLARILNGCEKEYSFSALRVPRAIVRKALLDEVKVRGIPIHYNKRCIAIREELDDVIITFEGGDTVLAEYVVGADGINSIVRRSVNPDSGPKYSGLLAVIGTVQKKNLGIVEIDLELPCMLYGKGGSFTIMPASYDGEEIGFFATVEYPDQSIQEWTQLEKNKEKLRGVLDDLTEEGIWPSSVKKLIAAVSPETLEIWP
jgi:2-polyprenyl-6-methoxyphenol hydroxylase-like FAD-dependent oxidoreductase